MSWSENWTWRVQTKYSFSNRLNCQKRLQCQSAVIHIGWIGSILPSRLPTHFVPPVQQVLATHYQRISLERDRTLLRNVRPLTINSLQGVRLLEKDYQFHFEWNRRGSPIWAGMEVSEVMGWDSDNATISPLPNPLLMGLMLIEFTYIQKVRTIRSDIWNGRDYLSQLCKKIMCLNVIILISYFIWMMKLWWYWTDLW